MKSIIRLLLRVVLFIPIGVAWLVSLVLVTLVGIGVWAFEGEWFNPVEITNRMMFD